MSSSDVETVRSGSSGISRIAKPTMLPRAGGPSRPAAAAARAPLPTRTMSASRVAALGTGAARPAAGASGARRPVVAPTLPRQPLSATTNRPATVGRTPSGMTAKGKTAAAVGGVRRVPSAGAPRPRQSDGRMTAFESQLSSLQEMLDLERQKTTALLSQERAERTRQNEMVRAELEEELSEKFKIAKEAVSQRQASVTQEQLDEITFKHTRERRLLEDDLDRERQTVSALKASLGQQSTAQLTMESTNVALRTQLGAQADELEAKNASIARLESEVAQLRLSTSTLEEELRGAETLRRKLHNEVQELRGNIRVFARVRPALPREASAGLATLRFPDPREAAQIELLAAGESATGTATMRNHGFRFDRVFRPEATQADVFDEVSHLTQSVLDGYNTCIFAYGQTGSGKTHSLEGGSNLSLSVGADPSNDAEAGLIPRAVQMLWNTAESLQDKGWRYDFEGQMLEIYNEGINDLLGKDNIDSGKHEIKHEKGRTFVSDTVVAPLDSPARVFALLAKAKSRRQVAATLMNERSSRSHSVFILRVRGSNATTMESCDATLSLVDLAGSERLSNSGSGTDPTRLKEAQCINKSLSSLADVIAALGAAKSGGHVPYRNSTLTWLLKNSLGGNSKTLMLLALSPMAEHLSESLCSLRFASKVNSTVIGTARKVKGGDTSA